jgi:hypothetical protein
MSLPPLAFVPCQTTIGLPLARRPSRGRCGKDQPKSPSTSTGIDQVDSPAALKRMVKVPSSFERAMNKPRKADLLGFLRRLCL